MSGAIQSLESGGQNSAIIVHAPAGLHVTLTCGDVVRTTTEENGVWRFENCERGTWTVTASKDGMTKISQVEIAEEGQLMRCEVNIFYVRHYGIMRDITSSSPAWTRTDYAESITATASQGTVAGHSDFDGIYPWSEIHRETLSTGDVIVKIPKFWYKRYREGNVEYLKIADEQDEGYKLHPAFCHGGVERDALYIGEYKTSESFMSVSGAAPAVSKTRAAFRTGVTNKGSGWHLMDVAAVSALQMLYLMEFADFNAQVMIGKGYCNGFQYNGDKMATGSTDGVPNLTGRPAGVDGKVDVVWRGMEGLWGNTYEYMGGLNIDCGTKGYYVSNDPELYTDGSVSNQTLLSYPLAVVGSSNNYITQLGLDPDQDHIMLPSAAGSGSSTFICDVTSTASSGISIAKVSGKWFSGDKSGFFKVDGTSASGKAYAHSGSRMIFIP